MTGSNLVYGVFLPALIAGVLLLLGGRGTRLAGRPRPFLGALAIGAGYLVAHWMIVGEIFVPPSGERVPAPVDWLAWIVLGVIVLALLRGWPDRARWIGSMYIVLFSLLVSHLIVGSALDDDVAGHFGRAALAAALVVVWYALERLALKSSGPALPFALLVAGSGIAVCSLSSHVAVFAQLTGAVCSALGAALLLGVLDKAFRLPIGAVAVTVVVYAAAIVQAWIYGLPPLAAVLLVVSVVAAWVSETGKLAHASPVKRALIAAGAAAVPAAIAVALTRAAFHSGASGS